MNFCHKILRAATPLAALFVPFPSVAQPPAATASRQQVEMPRDTAVRTGTLPNGLTYYVRANAKPAEMAELRLIVRAGSNQEDDDQRGIAHFVEHMAFNGTERFKKNELIAYLKTLGVKFGADLNAVTTFDHTMYELKIPAKDTGRLATGLDVLAEWTSKLTFDSLEVVAERGVILEEWRRGLAPGSALRESQLALSYAGSKYADRLPIGLPSTIETTNPSLLKRYYHDWYRPNLMAVIMIGPVDPDRVVAMIKDRFGGLANPANERPREQYGVPEHDAPIFFMTIDTMISSPSISVQYRFKNERGIDPRTQTRNTLLWNFMTSIVNQRLSESAQVPNPPFHGGQIGIGGLGELDYTFSVSVTPRPDAIVTGFRSVLAEIERVVRHGVTSEEFERIRMATRQQTERAFTHRSELQSGAYAQEYVSAFLNELPLIDPAAEYALFLDALNTIDKEELKEVAQVWREPKNRVISVMLPKRNDINIPDSTSILAAFNRVQQMPLTAYVEPPAPTKLMETLPQSGAIVKTVQHDHEITEWTLSNGIRVLLRPSANTTDQLSVFGQSPGGFYLNVKQYGIVPASTATELVSGGGIGTFSPADLGRMLAGRSVRAGASIEPYSESLNGGAVWTDAETMFQLMYLAVTQPRIDTTTFRSMIGRAREQLEHQGYNPDQAFQDTMRLTMAQYHPWASMSPEATLDSMDIHKSLAVFRDRFSDMSDFRFIITGNFELDSIAPYVTQYLGALPGGGRKEQISDPGIRPPSGVVRKIVEGGDEPKTTTMLTFTGETTLNRGTSWDISGLGLILQQRLHARLRDDLSGTYSVQASATSGRIPTATYTVQISYVSAPERADEMLAATFAVLNELRTTPVLASEITTIRDEQIKALHGAVDSDQFWITRIALFDDLGVPFSEITNDAILREWSPEHVQRAAQEYLRMDKYILFQQVPAGGK